LNAEQRERNNHRFLITSTFVVVQTTARGKSFLLSFSDEANSNTTRRIESLGRKRFEFSLSLSLSYSVRKSALFPPALLSFASFERAFEKNYSVQTPLLLLLLLFVVLLLVLLLKNTNTSNWSREKKSEFLSRFLLFFFSRAELLSVCLLFSSLLFLFRFFLLSFVLSSHFFCSREHTHNINNTRPKIMVRSLYTYARIHIAFVFVVFLVLFSLLKEKSS